MTKSDLSSSDKERLRLSAPFGHKKITSFVIYSLLLFFWYLCPPDRAFVFGCAPCPDCLVLFVWWQIHADETKSSLQFASRALRVTNCARVNEVLI